MFDAGLLGLRVVEALCAASNAGAIAPGARMVPRAAAVYAVLAEARLRTVSGFDLASMDGLRWHPGTQPANTDEPLRVLSQPFAVAAYDLQAWLDGPRDPAALASDGVLHIGATADGVANAVALWFSLDLLGDGSAIAGSRPPPGCGGDDIGTARSWPHGVCHLDAASVRLGDTLALRVVRDATQLAFALATTTGQPRHASVPAWTFSMLRDDERAAAFDRAIARSVRLSLAQLPRGEKVCGPSHWVGRPNPISHLLSAPGLGPGRRLWAVGHDGCPSRRSRGDAG